jgi:hypothetical protein
MGKDEGTARSRDYPFFLRKWIILTFFIVSVVAISATVLFALGSEGNVSGRIQLMLGLLITLGATFLGAFLNVLLDVPNMASEFDPIKNAIANRNISSPAEFSEKVVEFLTRFFSFVFFDVRHALVFVIKEEYQFSSNDLRNALTSEDLEYVKEKSKELPDGFLYKTIEVAGSKNYMYVVPIIFGDRWLGYFAVLTSMRLLGVFQQVLSQFEDDYLDDQLIHVLDYKKQKIQKQLYRDMDVFSDKISLCQYTTLRGYQEDVLGLLVEKTSAIGGVFITCYNDEHVFQFPANQNLTATEKELIVSRRIPSSVGVHRDPNVKFAYVYEIPIRIDKTQGVILLFSNTNEHFEYFDQTLREIENVLLDNDLNQLAKQLDLKRIHELE